MGARTTAREAALQMLFAIDASGTEVERAISEFWRELPGDAEDRAYADDAVRGVHATLARIDERIAKASTNWRVERMARVDRNVLRLGVWELSERKDVPRAVVLDEAVEVAKRFGTEESGAFVNGVLDRIADDLGRKDDDRPPKPESAESANDSESKPSVEDAKSAEGTENVNDSESKPSVEDAKSAEGTENANDGESKPSVENANDGESKPSVENANDGTSKPT